jgi:hypothetical protein
MSFYANVVTIYLKIMPGRYLFAAAVLGDSTLIHRFCSKYATSLIQSTDENVIGIDFSVLSTTLMSGEAVTWQIWHFIDIFNPKHRRFRPLIETFSHQMSGAMIFIDLNKSMPISQIEYWDAFIQTRTYKSPIILIANTSKHTPESLIALKYLRNYLEEHPDIANYMYLKEINLENADEVVEVNQFFLRQILTNHRTHGEFDWQIEVLYEKIQFNLPLDEIDREMLGNVHHYEEILAYARSILNETSRAVIMLLERRFSLPNAEFRLML